MQALLASLLMATVENAEAAENYLIFTCVHPDTVNKVSVENQAGSSSTYFLKVGCRTNATPPVEIQSNYLAVDEKIVLSCERGCFKETIALEDIILRPNRTERTCEGEEKTCLLPVSEIMVARHRF